MSSVYTRTGRKVKEFFGAKKTKSETLEQKLKDAYQLESEMKLLKSTIVGISNQLSNNSKYYSSFSKQLKSVYDPESLFRITAVMISETFLNHSLIIDEMLSQLKDLNSQFAQWFDSFDKLRINQKNLAPIRLRYDHYKQKLVNLNDKINKKAEITQKEQEKLARNKKKFAQAEQIYNSNVSNLVDECERILNNRYLLLNPVIVKFVQIHTQSQSKLYNYYAVHENIEETMKKNKEKQEEILSKKKMIQSMVEGNPYKKSQSPELSLEEEIRLKAQKLKNNKSEVTGLKQNMTVEEELRLEMQKSKQQTQQKKLQQQQQQNQGNLSDFELRLKQFQAKQASDRQTMQGYPRYDEEEKKDDPFNQWSSNYASRPQRHTVGQLKKKEEDEDDGFNNFYKQYNYDYQK